jgi:hypothetical protein
MRPHLPVLLALGLAVAGLPSLLLGVEGDSAGRTTTTWTPIAKDAVPAEAMATFTQVAAGSALSGFQKVDRKGRVRYSAVCAGPGSAHQTIVVYADGTLLSADGTPSTPAP